MLLLTTTDYTGSGYRCGVGHLQSVCYYWSVHGSAGGRRYPQDRWPHCSRNSSMFFFFVAVIFIFRVCTVALEAGDTCKIHGLTVHDIQVGFFFEISFSCVFSGSRGRLFSQDRYNRQPMVFRIVFFFGLLFFQFCIVTVHGKVALEADYSRKIDSPQHSGSLFYFFFRIYYCFYALYSGSRGRLFSQNR